MPKDVNKGKSIKRTKFLTELCISLVIVALGAYAFKICWDRVKPLSSSDVVYNESSEPQQAATEANDENKIIFESVNVSTKDKFKGSLILVNTDYEYFKGEESLVYINEKLNEDGRTAYSANTNEIQINETVYEPMSRMIEDFNAATGYDDIIIYDAYRSSEQQEELYNADKDSDEGEASAKAAAPGHSEHECGYAFDLSTYPDYDYDGTGEYEWINKNCWKYGMILRYTTEKAAVTKMDPEPWHYRYVGVPHAYYMYTNNLCFEEYIEEVHNHPYEGEHLVFSDENGAEYEVYFVASDDGSDTSIVPVPSGLKYEISGNNVDGFIVTVYKNETADSAPASPASEGATEESTDTGESDEAGDSGESGESSDSGSEDENNSSTETV